MAKTKIRYVCANCGSVSSRWLGRCPQCGEWNTMMEEQAGDFPGCFSIQNYYQNVPEIVEVL